MSWLAGLARCCTAAVAQEPAAAPLPPFPEPERSALREAVAEWIQAVMDGRPAEVAERGQAATVAFESLAANYPVDPLRNLEAWSALLREARSPERPTEEPVIEAVSPRFRQPYRLLLPDQRAFTAGPLPLLILIGNQVDPEDDLVEVPVAFRRSWLILQLNFLDLPIEDLSLAGRRRLVDAIADVLAAYPVDRNRVSLVSQPGGEIPATVFAALLPHFFQTVGLVAPTWVQGWPGPEAIVRRQRGVAALWSLPRRIPHPGFPIALNPFVLGLLEIDIDDDLRDRQTFAADLLKHCRMNFREGAWGQFPDMPSALSYLRDAAPREPYPLELDYRLMDPWSGRLYWILVQAFEYGVELEEPSAIRAQVFPQENRILIAGRGVYSLDLYLNDALLDLDRPVVIEFDGSPLTRRLQVQRSFATLLENFARNPDPETVYPAMIRWLDLPASR